MEKKLVRCNKFWASRRRGILSVPGSCDHPLQVGTRLKYDVSTSPLDRHLSSDKFLRPREKIMDLKYPDSKPIWELFFSNLWPARNALKNELH